MTEDPQDSSRRGVAETPFASLKETHTAVVVFVGDRAFKLKKAVRYDFLDFTTVEARWAACRKEVELNRRLAADVYLGVAELRVPGQEGVEPLVAMRRLPAGRALSALATNGVDMGSALDELANLLARFHAGGAHSPVASASASAAVTLERWRSNAAGLTPLIGRVFDAQGHRRALELATRYVAGRDALFAARIAAGRAVDGHGDLLADDVFVLDDGPRVLDCLEFDDRLRGGDALGDVCSLSMDLERLGRADLAGRFTHAYQEASGDRWPGSLAHHYIAYRAHVRALVAGLRFEQGDAGSAELGQRLFSLCLSHLEAGRVRLVVVGGLPGTGKTTVAGWAAAALDAVLLRSDVLRKSLAGLDPSAPAPAAFEHDLYRPELTAATYRRLFDEARAELAMGRSVVLDATFADGSLRESARRLASDIWGDLDELRCVAPPAVAESRITARAAAGVDPSDATVAVARHLDERTDAWPEAVALETVGDPELVRQRLLSRLRVDQLIAPDRGAQGRARR